MTNLAAKTCVPCEGGIPRLATARVEELLAQIGAWSLTNNGNSIERKINTEMFSRGIELVNRIADQAEQQQHHPDLHLTGYRHLRVELTTHAAGGLTENDFILAAKIDQILAG